MDYDNNQYVLGYLIGHGTLQIWAAIIARSCYLTLDIRELLRERYRNPFVKCNLWIKQFAETKVNYMLQYADNVPSCMETQALEVLEELNTHGYLS